jgi:hypothetical protein
MEKDALLMGPSETTFLWRPHFMECLWAPRESAKELQLGERGVAVVTKDAGIPDCAHLQQRGLEF